MKLLALCVSLLLGSVLALGVYRLYEYKRTLALPKAEARFAPGDMVEFKGLGVRSIVERVRCSYIECTYDLRLNYGPRETDVPEIVLEPVKRRK